MKRIRTGIGLGVVLATLLFGVSGSRTGGAALARGAEFDEGTDVPIAPWGSAQDGAGPKVIPRSGDALLGNDADDRAANGGNVAASTGIKETATPQEVASGTACADGMVEVEGDYCPNVDQKCLRWLDPETKMRCAEFAPSGACQGKTTHKHFCIDRYEYPNQVGEKPVVMKTWYEARDACRATGKRLCGDSEWTLACEGQERLPYPYGHARNSEACNIDKPHPDADEKAIANPKTRDAEVARLWQGEPSGTRESCVSAYGVYDMTGNVDEWVVNESGQPYKSGLKGGYWGPVRTRCRPMTTAHYEEFIFYQIGFRCCDDAAADGAASGAVTSSKALSPAPVGEASSRARAGAHALDAPLNRLVLANSSAPGT